VAARVAPWFVLFALVLTACGGTDAGETAAALPDEGREPVAGSIEALWRAPGEDIGLIQGTMDYAPGENRVVFLVILDDGTQVAENEARVWVSHGLEEEPFLETTASLESVGVPGGAANDDVEAVYVTRVELPEPGTYWLLAEPVGGDRPVQGLATLEVKDEPSSPAVGAKAPASNTPTLESAGGDLASLSTAEAPDEELYRHSVARSLADGVPFVVAFATPKFCQSRTCGPVVDIVDAVRRDLGETELRFIHVEIYEENDPTLGVNRWVREWNLPSEPWVFVVGRDGRIASKFEGAVSVDELRAAVDALA
jgi:hypothetical protein